MTKVSLSQSIHGCLFGLMIGDALGASVEFMRASETRETGRERCRRPAGDYQRRGRVTVREGDRAGDRRAGGREKESEINRRRS